MAMARNTWRVTTGLFDRAAENIKHYKHLKIIQLNMQHKRLATQNLVQIMDTHNIDLAMVQEPYNVNNNLSGIPTSYSTYTHGNNRKRAAIIVRNKFIKVLMITQMSNEDCTVIQITHNNHTIYAVSMYSDRTNDVEVDLQKIEAILRFAKGMGLIISIDCNARSNMWYDPVENQRGRKVEEFITANDLYIMNEDRNIPTFDGATGSSYVDLTITCSKLAHKVQNWSIGEEESCSDHNLISFNVELEADRGKMEYARNRFIIRENKWEIFQDRIMSELKRSYDIPGISMDESDLDIKLEENIEKSADIKSDMARYKEALWKACSSSFGIPNRKGKEPKGKTVPWWTNDLTVLRKRVNSDRRKYQRTTTNRMLREKRKIIYLERKGQYEALISQEKLKAWREYCNITSGANPWNVAYRLGKGKTKENCILATLKQPNGEYTTSIKSTLDHMLQHFAAMDDEANDKDEHKALRKLVLDPIETEDDEVFSCKEIEDVLRKMNPKKAPGEDGITSDIILKVHMILPKFQTALYNKCLSRAYFPEEWKTALIYPIVKPGKESFEDVSKYRPISLINVGGKVLEKLTINRIMKHIQTNNYLNKNQFGFIPHKNTIDAVMALKEYVKDCLNVGEIVVVTSLDVKGAFDAAWWPSIMKNLRDFKCPKNLFELTKSTSAIE